MEASILKRVLVHCFWWVAPACLALLLFRPIFLRLQYECPDDGGAELLIVALALVLLGWSVGLATGDRTIGRRLIFIALASFVVPCLFSSTYELIFQPRATGEAEWTRWLLFWTVFLILSAAIVALFALQTHVPTRRWTWRAKHFVTRPLFSFVLTVHVCSASIVLVPEVSRSIGPWAPVRSALYEDGRRFEETARALQVELTVASVNANWDRLKAAFQVRRMRWPGRTEEISIRPMRTDFPYVGIDYGNGRNCVFEWPSMRSDYCD
jgi:hypothetical protein